MQSDPFNKKVLLQRLQSMQPTARAAFSAAIASRMMHSYELATKGNSRDLRVALEFAWDSILKENLSVADCQRQLEIVMEHIRNEAEKTGGPNLYIEDPLAAVAYTLRTIDSENPEEPTWAAQRMFETISRHIRTTMQLNLKGPELLAEILKHPIMQAEFSRQFQDLDELSNWAPKTGRVVKDRAEGNPAIPEGSY